MRAAVVVLALVGCAGGESEGGLAILGGGAHDPAAITIEVLGDASNGLNQPTDVAVNPRAPEQIWITNFADNSVVRFAGDQFFGRYNSPGSEHFLASPSSLAFSDFGNFATAQDTDEVTQSFTPADFMGPTLWDDSAMFDAGAAGHLDMLHNTPNGGGIAWERDNVYWLVDGYHSSLTRYDFADDHGYGGSDHSDGIIDRYAEGQISHVKGIPTHADMADGILYTADAGGARIFRFDPQGASRSGAIGPDYDGADMSRYTGGSGTTLANGWLVPVLDESGDPTVEPVELGLPAGVEVHEGLVWVTDFASGNILALTLDGDLVDWVPTGRQNALAGIDIDAEGRLLVVDKLNSELLRISP